MAKRSVCRVEKSGRGVKLRCGSGGLSGLGSVRVSSCDKFLGGRPDVIDRMKFGGTRYKYDHGVFIDQVFGRGSKPDMYLVAQSGRPSRRLGKARTLRRAKLIACEKAET